MFGSFMGNSVDYAVRRDHDRGNAWTLTERESKRVPGTTIRLRMIVEAIGLIVGDDNGALRPIGAVGDRVDRVAQKGFADLRVGVAWVIVVALESGLDRRAGVARNEAIEVAISAADVIDSAGSGAGQGGCVKGGEEVAEALHVGRGLVRVVGLIAEVLWGIVMGDVVDIGGYAGRVGRLVIIA